MGCDIHLHQEIKINNEWRHYGAPNMPRNYRLFELMAGVRGDVKNAIASPRGLPSDVTFLTNFAFKFEGGHTPSWLNAYEIKRLEDLAGEFMPGTQYRSFMAEVDLCWGYLFGNGWGDFVRHGKQTRVHKYISDVRFIFWFDS